jgi:hypothetical protein
MSSQIKEYSIPAVLGVVDNLKNYVRKAIRANVYEIEDIHQIQENFLAIVEVIKHLEKIQNAIKEAQNQQIKQ